MICPKCQYENKEGAAVCNLCGTVLGRPGGFAGAPSPRDRVHGQDDLYPTPTAFSTDPRTPAPPSEFDFLSAQERETARKAKAWFIAAGALVVVAVISWVVVRLPYSDERIDAMYAEYVASAPNTAFPDSFHSSQARREETPQYLFQIAHAYDEAFIKQNPYALVSERTEQRLASLKAGKGDPGFEDIPTFSDTDGKTLRRIDHVDSVTGRIYGAGSKPFDTLRSLAGGDEQGKEMRSLERELVSGEMETQMRSVSIQEANRVNLYKKLEDKTHEELKYFTENGTPKLRSVARRMQHRLFEGNTEPVR